MGFDIKKAISRFSPICQTQQQHSGSKMVNQFPKESLRGSTSVAAKPPRKSREKVSSYTPPRKSRRREGKATTITKSVKFDDCKCNKNVKVSPLGTGISSSSTKSLSTSLLTSSSDIKRRNFEANSTSISSIEDPLKTTGSSLGLAANEARLPLPIGVHSRNLSYGTIYNACKTTKPKEETPRSKDDRQNAGVVDGNRGELKRSGSMRYAFGLGECNYGHGSIINGVKSPKSVKKNQSSCPDPSLLEANVEELKNAGNREYKKGLFENAISLYDKAIALSPLNASCHHNKAAALTLLGRIKEAVEECLEAVNCDPSYVRAHHRLGNLYTRLGLVDEAKRHFKLTGHGRGSEAVQRVLVVEAALKKMREALKAEYWDRLLTECSRAIEAGADACEEVVAAKAEALLKLKRANEALEVLVAAKRMSKRSCSKLLVLTIELYLFLGRFEEAAQAAEEAVFLEFNRNSLMQLKKAWGAADAYKAGNEYYKIGKHSEACAMYDQALQYVPSNCVILCKRASSKFKLGQWERTIEDCNAALKGCPNYSEAILQRAQAHTKLGCWEDAQRDYLLLGKQTTVSKSLRDIQLGLKGAKRCQQLNRI